MELVFLGTGGGRFNLISQVRRTGGFRINGPLCMHVDPGPGALISSLAFSQDPRKVELLVATHNHIDHVNDAGLIVEAMTSGSWKRINGAPYRSPQFAIRKKGGLLGSKSVVQGDEHGDRGVSLYHQGKLERVEIAQVGKMLKFGSGKKTASIVPAPVRHEDKTGFGFVLEMAGKRIGYTSDTEHFAGLGKHYAGCDALVVNSLKPRKDNVPGHLYTATAIELLQEAQPRLALLSHLGTGMLSAGPEKEAEKMEAASGVRTIAARDGMRLDCTTLRFSEGKQG